MIGIVADTNIYISALHFRGVCDDVLLLARQGQIKLFISDPIKTETADVLKKKFKWTHINIQEALRQIDAFSTTVKPSKSLNVIKRDPADDRILECAQEALANVIVSGDLDLLDLRNYRDIEIMTPADFLKFIIEQ